MKSISKSLLILVFIGLLLLSACRVKTYPPTDEPLVDYPNLTEVENPPEGEEISSVTDTTIGLTTSTTIKKPIDVEKAKFKFEEGTIVKIPLKVKDADGDKLTYSFSTPLNSSGEWLTSVGDAGVYQVPIAVSDGKTTVRDSITIEVYKKNSAPIIELDSTQKFTEGDLILLSPVVTDPDGDPVKVTYSGWMLTDNYQTTYKDAGTYKVTITASDGKSQTIKDITVIVADKNRPPKLTINSPEYLIVKEGTFVKIDAVALDLDNDPISITYSPPINDKGEWQTTIGDAGVYNIKVVASDTKEEVTQTMKIQVNPANQKPTMKLIKDVLVTVYYDREPRTVTIELKPEVTDPDGDKISITYSGFMTEASKTVGWEDGGDHNVLVTATDGTYTVSQTVKVTVNRAPCFCWEEPCACP